MMQLRIAGTVENSIVDGEGIRYTIFVQGCPHGCPECHNPQTHDINEGEEITPRELAKMVLQNLMYTIIIVFIQKSDYLFLVYTMFQMPLLVLLFAHNMEFQNIL